MMMTPPFGTLPFVQGRREVLSAPVTANDEVECGAIEKAPRAADGVSAQSARVEQKRHSSHLRKMSSVCQVESFITWLTPQPSLDERPRSLNSPFDVGEPAPLVRRAIDEVTLHLRQGVIGSGRTTDVLYGPEGGKMFGVLVVEAHDGRVGFLKAFSGQLRQSWDVEGWVPPVFDRVARLAVEPAGERVVKELTARVESYRQSAHRLELLEAKRQLTAAQEAERAAIRHEHEARKVVRHRERERLRAEGLDGAEALRALDRQSQTDDVELQNRKREWRAAREALEDLLRRDARHLAALERLRRIVSQVVSWQIYDTYVFENVRGQQRSVRSLLFPKVPSSGTGDCAAPKLIMFAIRHGLRPLGLAEFWWGAPPPGGGRIEGSFFPACKDKCGPLLPFLLEGLDVLPSRRFQPKDLRAHELEVVLEDARFIVVLKPEGLLSVPGTDASVTDSVLARVRLRHPNASGPLIVHRLDVETSGLMVVALDAAAAVGLQAQFIARTVQKRYAAVLEGLLERDTGVISLPLRVDLEQRPRQLVDFVNGKAAETSFEVLERANGRTRVAFFPKTGRTHQLRVHAAHSLGLGLPIVGDRLYGRPDRRLLLHAERLSFTHPTTGLLVTVEAQAPF
jgi:tRNA pseudouridine32 synthase / 23S rRNA pseudouridine746 synthase